MKNQSSQKVNQSSPDKDQGLSSNTSQFSFKSFKSFENQQAGQLMSPMKLTKLMQDDQVVERAPKNDEEAESGRSDFSLSSIKNLEQVKEYEMMEALEEAEQKPDAELEISESATSEGRVSSRSRDDQSQSQSDDALSDGSYRLVRTQKPLAPKHDLKSQNAGFPPEVYSKIQNKHRAMEDSVNLVYKLAEMYQIENQPEQGWPSDWRGKYYRKEETKHITKNKCLNTQQTYTQFTYTHNKENTLKLGDAFNRIRDFVLFLKDDVIFRKTFLSQREVERIQMWSEKAMGHVNKCCQLRAFNEKQRDNISRLHSEIQQSIRSASKYNGLIQPKDLVIPRAEPITTKRAAIVRSERTVKAAVAQASKENQSPEYKITKFQGRQQTDPWKSMIREGENTIVASKVPFAEQRTDLNNVFNHATASSSMSMLNKLVQGDESNNPERLKYANQKLQHQYQHQHYQQAMNVMNRSEMLPLAAPYIQESKAYSPYASTVRHPGLFKHQTQAPPRPSMPQVQMPYENSTLKLFQDTGFAEQLKFKEQEALQNGMKQHEKVDQTKLEPHQVLDYSLVEEDVDQKFKSNSMSKSTAINVLKLINFLNNALEDDELGHKSNLFYYGPSIFGMTTLNQVQFSIDFTMPDSNLSQIEILQLIYQKLESKGKIAELEKYFELFVEESYKKRISCQQLMNSVVCLSPVQKNSMWRQGTKIQFTSGNHAKVLESILFQIYCSISPQFNSVAVVLKKWVNDINELNLRKNNNKQTIIYKWNTVIMVFIYYMQKKDLLPVLQESSLQKAFEFLQKVKSTNFSTSQCQETLERLQKYSSTSAIQTFSNQFNFVKIPKDIIGQIKPVSKFLKMINQPINHELQKQKPGKLLRDFLDWVVHDLAEPESAYRKLPIRVLEKNCPNLNMQHKSEKYDDARISQQYAPYQQQQANLIFNVQHLFSDQQMSLVSSPVPQSKALANPQIRSLLVMETRLVAHMKEYLAYLDSLRRIKSSLTSSQLSQCQYLQQRQQQAKIDEQMKQSIAKEQMLQQKEQYDMYYENQDCQQDSSTDLGNQDNFEHNLPLFDNQNEYNRKVQVQNESKHESKQLGEIRDQLLNFKKNFPELDASQQKHEAKDLYLKFYQQIQQMSIKADNHCITNQVVQGGIDRDVLNGCEYIMKDFTDLQNGRNILPTSTFTELKMKFGQFCSKFQLNQQCQYMPKLNCEKQIQSIQKVAQFPVDIVRQNEQSINYNTAHQYQNFQRLNQQIDSIYSESQASLEFTDRIEQCHQDIQKVLGFSHEFQNQFGQQGVFEGRRGYQILKYGSTVNGLTSESSDLDLTILINRFDVEHEVVLAMLKEALLGSGTNGTAPSRYEVSSQMPRLIKPGWILKFRDTHLDLEVDIMVNKVAEVLHSNMILEYSRLDPRFKKLVQVLKKWNKNISSNINNRLNNYSIYLMLIAYMQSKKLLPNLQAMGKERKSIVQHQIQTENQGFAVNVVQAINAHFVTKEQLDEFDFIKQDRDDLSAAELLYQFFYHYAYEFKSSTHGIDISQLSCQNQNALGTEPDVHTFYQGKPFVERYHLLDMLKSHDNLKHAKVCKHTTIQNPEQNLRELESYAYQNLHQQAYRHLYLIVDPFNHCYNPAKNIGEDSLYPHVFQDAVKSMQQEGKLGLKCYD